MDTRALLTVAEDLEYLGGPWCADPSEADIRRGSALLRRLLVEDVLGSAWRAAGFRGEPALIAPDLDAYLRPTSRTATVVATAGGATYQGHYLSLFVITRSDPGASAEPVSDLPVEQLARHSFPLSRFLASTCAVIHGETVSRREVVKYMANVWGGVHLGPPAPVPAAQQVVQRLVNLEAFLRLYNTNGFFYELLSVGQSVGTSPDSIALISRIRTPVRT